jgi:hypothetical protein
MTATAVLLLAGASRADFATSPPKDPRRFVGIGAVTPDPGEEPPPANLELGTSTRGRVTWIGFSADLPLSARFSVVPRLELLRVGVIGTSQSEWYPHVGGGL